MSSICFFTPRNSQGKAPTNSFTYQSKAQLVIRHMHPVALATWDYFLVENISEEWDLPRKVSLPKNMFYSSSVPLGVACFGICLMFLLKTNMCVCVLLLFWCFCLHFCLPRFLSLPLSPSPLSFPPQCVNEFVHVFVWVFHPWRDEKPRTICYAAVGHNRQHCCRVQ